MGFDAFTQDCKIIPQSFESYVQAKKLIGQIRFPHVDHTNTTSSSWIRSANFKSCDGMNGFLIISAGANTYIHQNVPISLWLSFKKAPSFGSFYNQKIKGKYRLRIY